MMQHISQNCQIKQQQCCGALQSSASSFFLTIEHTDNIVVSGICKHAVCPAVLPYYKPYPQSPTPTEPANVIETLIEILGKAA